MIPANSSTHAMMVDHRPQRKYCSAKVLDISDGGFLSIISQVTSLFNTDTAYMSTDVPLPQWIVPKSIPPED